MTQQHPITPPPNLIEEWISKSDIPGKDMCEGIATRAAQWGADQELEACCHWLDPKVPGYMICNLRTARRPKPPSLKEQALKAVERMQDLYPHQNNADTIRRALEELSDD